MDIFSRLPGALLPWYERNKRNLPWRADRDPYHVWVSEIMLQQTRVEAVKGYYIRFLTALPTIEALANADDALLHKLWEGLGYYSRVRNLKKAAKGIMEEHGGVFPVEYEQVRSLPGIGDYTAGAICSIAYDQPIPAVDGNVLRVVSRLTDDGTPVDTADVKKTVRERLMAIYPAEAGAFTQALMELGATVCGPNRKPGCERCPCNGFCLGMQRGTADCLPVKLPKKQKRKEERTVFILRYDNQYALHMRPEKGLLAGLWQFPNVPGRLNTEDALRQIEKYGLHPTEVRMQVARKHIFTHVEWDMLGYYVDVAETGGAFEWLTSEQVCTQAALPTAFRQFWQQTEKLA